MSNRFDAIDKETFDQFGEVAADLATRSFQFMKLVVPRPGSPPDWVVNKSHIVTGEDALGLPDYSAMGWDRFVGNNRPPVEGHWVPLLGNKKPPRPNSFTDTTQWDKWPDGRPKDPWTFRIQMALKIMTGELAGKVVLFNGENEASRYAISELLAAFKEKRRRPLVLLTSVKRDGENIFDPVFQIIRFTEDDTVIPGLNLAKHSTVTDGLKPAGDEPRPSSRTNGGANNLREHLHDEIPF